MVKGKCKTIKSVAKRVSVTGSGLLRSPRSMRGHKMLNDRAKRFRSGILSLTLDRKVKSMLGMSLRRRTK